MAKILIVDDHAANRQYLVTLLGYRKHELVEASDGLEALALVREVRPDLVITDILMPTMDGYEFVRRLRADADIASTPVVFCTAHYHVDEARELAAGCGVARILTKPCEPDLILRTVEESLRGEDELDPLTSTQEFHRDHVRVITDKLSQTADELGAANQRLQALVDIGLQLASEHDPDLLLKRVCHSARELIGARYGLLAVDTKGAEGGIYFTASGMTPDEVAGLEMPVLAAGIPGEAYGARRSRRLAQSEGAATDLGLPGGFPAVRSMLVTPVVSISRNYGWVCLANKLGADEFSEDDERLMTILSAQAGRIYENGSLYAEVEEHSRHLAAEVEQRRQAQEKVERLNRVHAVLSGINSLIVRERGRQEVFDEVCRIAVDHGGFGIAWIDALDPATGRLVPVAAGGADARAGEDGRLPAAPERPADPLIERAIVDRKPAVDNRLSDGGVRLGVRLMMAIRGGYRSRIAVPLLVDGRVTACLSLLTGETDFFTDEEVKLLRELAGNISFALGHMEKEEKLVYMAFFDELTHLPNRTLFMDRIEQHMRTGNGEPQPAALILLDLERLRMVNESLGSSGGDKLLVAIAARLDESCGGKDNLGRVSGDGYGILLRAVRDGTDAMHAIERIYARCFTDAYTIDGTELRMAARAGIALYPGDGGDAGTLYRNAEAALKRSKSTGNRYVFYAAEMNAQAAQVLSLETRLRKAVDAQRFVLHYQPKFNVADAGVSGVEALIRWEDPGKGLVPPAQFIPLLEETGLIVEVGRWALSRALDDYRDWLARGLNAPRVAVNISAIELQQRTFVDTVIEIVQQAGDIPEALEIEITESLMMQDLKQVIRVLNILRGLGITVAIDDFGTGYSSLSHVARLPVDKVKIDRSFIQGMMGNAQDMMIASITVVLAHSLGLRVIAEGVETDEQLEALRRLECDEVQGYLFSKPLPKAEVEAFLKPKP